MTPQSIIPNYSPFVPSAKLDADNEAFVEQVRAIATGKPLIVPTKNYFSMTVGTSSQSLSVPAGLTSLSVTTTFAISSSNPLAVIAVFNPSPAGVLANITLNMNGQYRLANVAQSSIGCPVTILGHGIKLQPVLRATTASDWFAAGDPIFASANINASTLRVLPFKLADGASHVKIEGQAEINLPIGMVNASSSAWLTALEQPDISDPFHTLTGIRIVGFTSYLAIAAISPVNGADISGHSAVVYTSPGLIVNGVYGGPPMPITVHETTAYTASRVVSW